MKMVAVVCNNIHEWKHFVDVSQWNFSKQNMRYKSTKYAFVDIQHNTAYLFVDVNFIKQYLEGYTLQRYIRMCTITPEQEQILNSYIRGE
jgi:hypothetical protein